MIEISANTQLQRIRKELNDFLTNRLPTPGISFGLGDNNDDLTHLQGIILGPEDSPYEKGVFKLSIELTDYPFKSPKIRFLTKVYHPNISQDGIICMDTLDEWSPAFTIRIGIYIYYAMLLCIQSLLTDPNPEDPLELQIAELYNTNIEKYNQRVREWVIIYAQE